MADSDVIGGIENLTDAVSGETPSYEYKNPNTDMMKAISKCIDAADGTIGSEYHYNNPNTDVIQKMDELADAIATHSGGGSSILITKTGTENKTYKAIDDSADGYSEFTVNVPTVQPVTQFRYFKWHITSIWGNEYFQASEFGFSDGTNLMTWPQDVVATSSLPLLEIYSIANLLDGSTDTKIVTEFHSGDVEDIVIDLGSENTVDITQYPYYYWGSSDDDESYRGRTPLKWQLFGSNSSDFSDAVLLDEVSSFTPYVKNKEMAYRGLMVSPVQNGGSELHLLYSLEQTQGGQWFNTGINTTQYDKLLFINSVNGDDGYMREIAISDIIVVNSGTANDYTEVFSEGAIGKMFICHIYNNELWVGYNASGSSGNVVNIYHETGESSGGIDYTESWIITNDSTTMSVHNKYNNNGSISSCRVYSQGGNVTQVEGDMNIRIGENTGWKWQMIATADMTYRVYDVINGILSELRTATNGTVVISNVDITDNITYEIRRYS